MNSPVHKAWGYILAICFLTTGVSSAITVTQNKMHPKIHFGFNLPYNSIGGDFNNEGFISGVNVAFSQPELDDGLGFGLTAGYTQIGRSNFGYGLELGYQRTKHNFETGQGGRDATLSIVNLDFKALYSAMPVQPFLLLGVAVPRLVIERGGHNTSGQYFDAKYKGLGLNMGGGVELYMLPNICLSGTAVYRLMRYSNVKGLDDWMEIGGGLNGNGISLMIGLTFNFPIR